MRKLPVEEAAQAVVNRQQAKDYVLTLSRQLAIVAKVE